MLFRMYGLPRSGRDYDVNVLCVGQNCIISFWISSGMAMGREPNVLTSDIKSFYVSFMWYFFKVLCSSYPFNAGIKWVSKTIRPEKIFATLNFN